jgi:hypothetical protein
VYAWCGARPWCWERKLLNLQAARNDDDRKTMYRSRHTYIGDMKTRTEMMLPTN